MSKMSECEGALQVYDNQIIRLLISLNHLQNGSRIVLPSRPYFEARSGSGFDEGSNPDSLLR